MPFQFLDDNASQVSSPLVAPITNQDSTAGAPKAEGFKFDDAEPSSDGGFKPLPNDKGRLPTADELQDLMAQGYKPNNDDLRTLYDYEKNRTFGQKVSATAKSAKEGFVSTVKAPIAAIGELAQKPSIDQAGRVIASLPEGIVGAASGLVGMVSKPFASAYDYVANSPYRSEEDNFQKWKLDYLTHHDVGASPLPQYITPDWVRGGEGQAFEPYPNLSSTVNTVASIPFFEAGAGASGLSKAIALPKLKLAAPLGNLAGKALEKTGATFKWLGERPEAITEGVTKRVLGEDVANKIGDTVNVGELPIAAAAELMGHPAVAATLAGAKALEKVAPAVTEAGAFARRLAEADPASPFGRLFSVAKDTNAPEWMRALANSWVTKVPAEVANVAATGAKATAAGGLFGAGLGLVSGDNPEEMGNKIGSGAAFGLLTAASSAPKLRKMQILERNMADIDRFYQAHLADGVSPEAMKKIGNDAMTWGAAAERIFGDGTRVRFADTSEGSPLPPIVKEQSGFYSPETKTLWINTDVSGDPAATALHEILHPLYDSEIANRPELKQTIDNSLAAEGKTLYAAKVRYILSLISDKVGAETDPLKKQQLINDAIQHYDNVYQQAKGDPNHWIYSEILAEAGARALYGTHPILDVTNPELNRTALDSMKGFLQKLGVNFKEKPQGEKTPTVLPGFENVIDSPALRKTVFKLVKAQKEYMPGISEAAPQGVKINKEMWGQHPGAPLEQNAQGVKANDFVIQKPDGKIVERNPAQVKRIVKNRRKEVNAAYPVGTVPVEAMDATPEIKVRKTPSGLVERSGTKLGPQFDSLTSFGKKTKENARDLEQAIEKGEARSGWYQQIGNSPDWKESVQKDTGAIEAQYKDFIPTSFLVDKQGNLLVRNYSLTAFDRKAAEWATRKGPVGLELWGGDIKKFKDDVALYLKNHGANLPGEANNLGVDKKNTINAFLVGGNRTFEASNPLRKLLKGNDRQGVVRSYRLDRLETLEPAKSEFSQPQYHKQVKNYSPKVPTSQLIKITGPDGKEYAAKFDGYQDFSAMGMGKIPQITPLEDIPGVITAKSTTYAPTLEKNGFKLPDLTQFDKKPGELHSEDLLTSSGQFQPPTDAKDEHIIQAALRLPDGKVFTGSTHAHAMMNMEPAGVDISKVLHMDEGFTTSTGRFVDRDEAKNIALKAGQIDKEKAKEVDERLNTEPNYTAGEKTPLESVTFGGARLFSPAAIAEQTKTPEFKKWFGASQVTDEQGTPKVVFSGHSNADVYGSSYDPKQGTAGAFYATEDPKIASNYAIGKIGQRESYENGSQYLFQRKNGKFSKKLWSMELTPEQQQKVREFMADEEKGGGAFDIEKYWKENAPFDKSARIGNMRGLTSLQSIYNFMEEMGLNLTYMSEDPTGKASVAERQQKSTFEDLLDHLGIPWKSKDWIQPGVFPLFLKVENPIDASKPFPADLLKALEAKAKYKRNQPFDLGLTWTKDYPLKQWVADIKNGDEFWSTHVPKEAVPIIKEFGYDGIKERGGKGGPDDTRQVNWVVFNPEQIKSAIGNKGTFDPNSPDMMFRPDTAETSSQSGAKAVEVKPPVKAIPTGQPDDKKKRE